MILSETEILDIVKKPQKKSIASSVDLQNDHKVHITGYGYEDAIVQITGYENAEQFKQKKLITKPFTKPLTKYLIDAQGRWKTAQGTVKAYKFKGENPLETSKDFKDNILSQVWKDSSMDNFVGKFLSKAIYTEFGGFFIVDKGRVEMDGTIKTETREGKVKQIEKNEDPKPYIIFKSAEDIHNFSVTGSSVDWIAYKVEEREGENKTKVEIFRVIDEQNDYIVHLEGGVAIINETLTIKHELGVTPSVPVTSINKELISDDERTSPIDAIVPILDHYLNQYANHVASCILHSHPIYYQIGQKCQYKNGHADCDGDGELVWTDDKGETIKQVCPSCNGAGHNIRKDASTVIILPAKTDSGEAMNISNAAGYVTPPIDILAHQMEELDAIKAEIVSAATGQIGSQTLNEKTATETVLNLKPLEDIIAEIIKVIEDVEKQLTDIIGKYSYGNQYIGAEIVYGRKLNLRDENLILEEIEKAKKNGSPYFYIRTLNEELIYSRFSKSKTDLKRNLVAAELEPYIGFTYDEVEDGLNITDVQKFVKQNFVDYFQRLELEDGRIEEQSANDGGILKMKEKLKQYAEADLKTKQESETKKQQENANSKTT